MKNPFLDSAGAARPSRRWRDGHAAARRGVPSTPASKRWSSTSRTSCAACTRTTSRRARTSSRPTPSARTASGCAPRPGRRVRDINFRAARLARDAREIQRPPGLRGRRDRAPPAACSRPSAICRPERGARGVPRAGGGAARRRRRSPDPGDRARTSRSCARPCSP